MLSLKKSFLVTLVNLVVQTVLPWVAFAAAPDFPALQTYSQTILIRFKTPEAAQKARLVMAGLYHDLDAAFSARWDDNSLNDLTVAKIMKSHGVKGTFYLNDPKGWTGPNVNGLTLSGDVGVALPKALLAGGNSIGVHTLNHEHLPWLSRNRAFEEILGGRIDREVSSQSPLVAFTYPFVSFKNDLDPEAGPALLEELLLRSGLYLLGEDSTWMPGSRLLTGRFIALDGTPSNGMSAQIERRRHRRGKDRTLYLSAMHAWPDVWGGNDFPKFSELVEQWGGVERTSVTGSHRGAAPMHPEATPQTGSSPIGGGEGRWWYCNQNQYAAYRAQVLKTRLTTQVEGDLMTVTILRPDPLDLGDLTPLSFILQNVSPGDALSVDCPGATAKPFGGTGVYGFDLFHDNARGLPVIYSKTENPENQADVEQAPPPEGLPGLHVRLHRKEGKLVLTVKNRGSRILHDMRVTFRVGPEWEDGVTIRPAGGLAPGGEKTLAITVKPRGHEAGTGPDARDARGDEFNAAQVDFLFGEFRARLYATCRVPEEKIDPSFARDGFLVLGPLPSDNKGFDFERFTWSILKGARIKKGYTLFEKVTVNWKVVLPNEAKGFDPNIVLTTGKPAAENFYTWDAALFYPHGKVLSYLLVGKLYSPTDLPVKLVTSTPGVSAWSVNGTLVEGRQTTLKKGWNDLRLLYGADPSGGTGFHPSHYGAYLRFTDESGKRMEDLRFERPRLP